MSELSYVHHHYYYIIIYLTAIVLTPGGSSTVHIYRQTVHRERNIHNNNKIYFGKCGPCPVFASYTLAFTLQLRKKHRKPSVRVAARTSQADIVQYKKNEQYNTQKKSRNTE
jgi:hypothetical protein